MLVIKLKYRLVPICQFGAVIRDSAFHEVYVHRLLIKSLNLGCELVVSLNFPLISVP